MSIEIEYNFPKSGKETYTKKTCKFCGCNFTTKSKHPDTKFCSDKHRYAYHNFFKKEKQKIKEAQNNETQ